MDDILWELHNRLQEIRGGEKLAGYTFADDYNVELNEHKISINTSKNKSNR